jgi:hypothetical protein
MTTACFTELLFLSACTNQTVRWAEGHFESSQSYFAVDPGLLKPHWIREGWLGIDSDGSTKAVVQRDGHDCLAFSPLVLMTMGLPACLKEHDF